MKMTRSEVVYLLLGVLCIIQLSNTAPVTDVRGDNSIVDEIIMKLKQLRQQSEAMKNHGRSGRLALTKKGQLDADHKALLYNLYNHPYAHYLEAPKRNFDEIDRLSDFDKRNFDEIDRMGSLYDFRKRNFDEIDRMGALTDF